MFSFKKFLQRQPKKPGGKADLKPRTQFAKKILKKKGATGHDILTALDIEHEKDLERKQSITKTGKSRKKIITGLKRWGHAELGPAQDDPSNPYFAKIPQSTIKHKEPIEPRKPPKPKPLSGKSRAYKAWKSSQED